MNAKFSNGRRRWLAAALAGAGACAGLGVARGAEHRIQVVAKRFEFTPNRIELKRGVPVVLELSTRDVPMGFSAPDFHVRADIVPGSVSHLRFTPDKTGEFTFLCDVFCGSGHEDMNGTLVVV
jgi:cytochrome c oxidase subunit II